MPTADRMVEAGAAPTPVLASSVHMNQPVDEAGGGAQVGAVQFERLLTDLSATFVGAEADEVDSRIEGALQAVVETLDMDRATLSQFSPDGTHIETTHNWAAAGTPPVVLQEIPEPALRWMISKLTAGQRIAFGNPTELEQDSRDAADYFRSHGVESHATVPLQVAGRAEGGLHVASTRRRDIDWEPLLPRLQVLGRIFATALDRQKTDIELRRAMEEISQLKKRLEDENVYLRDRVQGGETGSRLIGDSAAFDRALVKAGQVASTDSVVLLLGETGTGKDLFAQAIHKQSRRSRQPLIQIDCTALPPTLVESELFGHEKGAFSGANRSKPGRIELAHEGTLFLDEIGELPLDLQTKFLRVLETGEISRIGSVKSRKVDVRVIAATNRDLELEVEEGRFRSDLYYRLNVFPIELPPLRNRRDDIPLLVWHFVDMLQGGLGRKIEEVPDAAMQAMKDYRWPGNVRELRNVVERSLILSSGSTLEIEVSALRDSGGQASRQADEPPSDDLESLEREHIRRVLEGCGGRIKGKDGAAEKLGLKPSTLYNRLNKLGLR